MINPEYEKYLRDLKSQITHDIPLPEGVFEKEEKAPVKERQRPAKASAQPANQETNDAMKQRIEILQAEKSSLQARCDLLQEQFGALNAKYEAQIREIQILKINSERAPEKVPVVDPALARKIELLTRQLEEQGREFQHVVILRQQENDNFQHQLKAQTRQTDLLRMARDSGHATVIDLQRKLEEREHQSAEIEHQLSDEVVRRTKAEAALAALKKG